jgi:type VI protein secretion system component VasK
MTRGDLGRWWAEQAASLAAASVAWFLLSLTGWRETVRFAVLLVLWLAVAALLRFAPRAWLPAGWPVRGRSSPGAARRIADSLAGLRRATGGRYALPWYLVLGPDGAGRSTLLEQAGLPELPPPATWETPAGTLFATRAAAFIDVNGACISNETLDEPARDAWDALLDGLARGRPMLPLNGVLLVLSPADLSLADGLERHALAAGIAERLRELQERLGQRLPVYVLLTKLDLTPGFAEFFDHLDHDHRGQAWGFAFPHEEDRPGGSPAAGFDAAYGRLVEELKHRQLDLLHREQDPRRAALLLNFPAQLAALRPVVAEILSTVFLADETGRRRLLRGVYLTSGRQNWLSFDRLMPLLCARFGLPRSIALPPDLEEDEEAQNWFVDRPLRDVVLAEAGLVARGKSPYAGRLALRFGLAAATVAASLAALIVLGIEYRSDLERSESLVLAADERHLSNRREWDEQLRVLRYATEVEAAWSGPTLPVDWPSRPHLRQAAATLEAGVLDRAVLPRLVAILQDQLSDPTLTRAELVQALAVFDLLTTGIAPERGTLTAWIDRAARRLLPPDSGPHDQIRGLVVERSTARFLAAPPHLALDPAAARAAVARLRDH